MEWLKKYKLRRLQKKLDKVNKELEMFSFLEDGSYRPVALIPQTVLNLKAKRNKLKVDLGQISNTPDEKATVAAKQDKEPVCKICDGTGMIDMTRCCECLRIGSLPYQELKEAREKYKKGKK